MNTERKSLVRLIILATVFAIFISLLILKYTASLSKLIRQPQPKETEIEFDELVYDFGKTKEEEQIEYVFKFKNVGDEELIIDYVKAPCGCTAAVVSEKNIPPNGEGEIKVSFNTKGYSGFTSHNIYLSSNAPRAELKIQGFVESEISFSPKDIHFGDLMQGAAESRIVGIYKAGDENLKILKAESSSDYLTTQISEISEVPIPPRRKTDSEYDKYIKIFNMEVFLSADAPVGRLEEKITVHTTDKEHPIVEIPVTVNIRGFTEGGLAEMEDALLVFPPIFFFGKVKQGETPSVRVGIKTMGGDNLKIEKIENYMEDFISINVEPKIAGKEYEITASLKENIPVGEKEGSIIVHTNNTFQPQIEVPVNFSIE